VVATALTTIAYRALTAPYRTESVSEVKRAGAAILILAVVGAALGIGYALADRWLRIGPRATRLAGIAALVVLVAGLAAGLAIFYTRDYHQGWFGDQWRAFKGGTETAQTSSHLLQLGSWRYDIWRVALHEFEHHPLAGIGSRGFGPAYLQLRHSTDVPARAHSFELDALSELGIVGFLLVVCAVALPFVGVVRRMRAADPAATAAFAGCSYWLIHGTVDWIWTVPACGLPFFLLLGTGGAGGEREELGRRAAIPAAAVAVVVSLVAFVPPWLSARLTERGQIHWAKRLDPLSVDPYVAQAARARSPAASVAALQAAVRKQPRVVELRYDLALAYLHARQPRRARAELLVAHRLDPREPRIQDALKHLPKRPIGSN
jgi:hypothetical protein